MDGHQKCPVMLRQQSFAIKKVIPNIRVVNNNNSYTPEGIVLKHTSAKFDLDICKNEVNRKHAL